MKKKITKKPTVRITNKHLLERIKRIEAWMKRQYSYKIISFSRVGETVGKK